MALFSGLARETTGDLLVRVRVAALAMLLLGALFGGLMIYYWPVISEPDSLTQRLIHGGATVAPVVFAFIVYVYLALGVIPVLRERIASLTRSAENASQF